MDRMTEVKDYLRPIADDSRRLFWEIVARHEVWTAEKFEVEFERFSSEFDGNPWLYQFKTGKRIMCVFMDETGKPIPESTDLMLGTRD